MVSFVYLAVGELDGIPVFKVGKSSQPKHRRKTLGLQFRTYIACIDSAEALAVERYLQIRIESEGARRLPKKNDWFYFDDKLFQELVRWFEHETEDVIKKAYTPDADNEVSAGKLVEGNLKQLDASYDAILERIKTLEEQMKSHYHRSNSLTSDQ